MSEEKHNYKLLIHQANKLEITINCGTEENLKIIKEYYYNQGEEKAQTEAAVEKVFGCMNQIYSLNETPQFRIMLGEIEEEIHSLSNKTQEYQ